MATITRRGEKWRALIRMSGHPRLSATFNTHREAKSWARETEDRITKGEMLKSPAVARKEAGEELPNFPTFSEAADQRVRFLHLDEKSTTARRIRWWQERLGNKRIDEIRKAHIQKIVDELRTTPKLYGGYKVRESNKPRSEATITRYLTALSGVFSDHVDPEDGIPYNPARKIKTRPQSEQPMRYQEPEDIENVLEACGNSTYPRLYFLALSAYYTGARRSELLNLTWADVNVERGEAILDPTQTKTGEPRILIWVGAALEELRKWHACDKAQGREDGHLFPSPRYPDRKLVGLDRIWKRACKEAGIRMRWHDWRHQSGTEIILNGHSSITAAEHLGHKSLVMTKRYTRLATTRRREALERTFGYG